MSEQINTVEDLDKKIIKLSVEYAESHPNPKMINDINTMTYIYFALRPLAKDPHLKESALKLLSGYFLDNAMPSEDERKTS